MREFDSAIGAKVNSVPNTDSGSDTTTKNKLVVSSLRLLVPDAFGFLKIFFFCSRVKTKKLDFLQVIFLEKIVNKIFFWKKRECQGLDQKTIKKVNQRCLVHTLDSSIPREIVKMPFGIVFITRWWVYGHRARRVTRPGRSVRQEYAYLLQF